MVELQLPKLLTWVRFPSPAPIHSIFQIASYRRIRLCGIVGGHCGRPCQPLEMSSKPMVELSNLWLARCGGGRVSPVFQQEGHWRSATSSDARRNVYDPLAHGVSNPCGYTATESSPVANGAVVAVNSFGGTETAVPGRSRGNASVCRKGSEAANANAARECLETVANGGFRAPESIYYL
jgi:hypothetical protein